MRRGLGDPAAARAWLAAARGARPRRASPGIDAAVALILRHVEHGLADHRPRRLRRRRRLLDGDPRPRRCATSAPTCDWYLPSRTEDGYGLSRGHRRAPRRARDEAARHRRLRDHRRRGGRARRARAGHRRRRHRPPHAARRRRRCPTRRSSIPALCGYPCPDLCAAGVALQARRGAAVAAPARDPAGADEDLDLVALATVADSSRCTARTAGSCARGCARCGAREKPGPARAHARVAQVDPARSTPRRVGFRLAPRINAAGRLHRADAGPRARAHRRRGARAGRSPTSSTAPTPSAATPSSGSSSRPRRRSREAGRPQPAYVLAGEGWHPGVDRHRRRRGSPSATTARRCSSRWTATSGTGSGRSIPGFDLLGGLDACAEHLARHGGHRAAAGLEIARDERRRVPRRVRGARRRGAHARGPRARRARRRGRRRRRARPRPRRGARAPRAVRHGQPGRVAARPRRAPQRPAADGGGQARPLHGRGRRRRAPAPSRSATARAARRRRRPARRRRSASSSTSGAAPSSRAWCCATRARGARADRGRRRRPVATPCSPSSTRRCQARVAPREPARAGRDRRGGGIAGRVAALVATRRAGARRRRRRARAAPGTCAGRLGGFALTSYAALERDPSLAAALRARRRARPAAGVAGDRAAAPARCSHLAWGEPEVAFALRP